MLLSIADFSLEIQNNKEGLDISIAPRDDGFNLDVAGAAGLKKNQDYDFFDNSDDDAEKYDSEGYGYGYGGQFSCSIANGSGYERFIAGLVLQVST